MRLKHLAACPIVAGLNLPAEDGEPGWPRYIRTTDIAGPETLTDDVVRIAPEAVGDLDVCAGDLLFTRTGSLGTTYLHKGAEPAAFAGYLVRVRPNPRRADPRWLSYFARSARCQGQIAQGAIRSTIDNFNATKIANLAVPDLPVTAQQGIADFLDRECARIETVSEELGAASALATTAQTDGLRRVIFGTGADEVPLKFYAQTGTGHTPSRERPEYWIPSECVVPWFTLADIHQLRDGRREQVRETFECVSQAGLANSSAVKLAAGTVILSRTASVGFSAIMGVDMAVSQDFMTWTCGPNLEPRYLLLTLRAMQPELRGLMYGSTHKTIYMPDLHALRVPLPDRQVQLNVIHGASRIAASTWPLVDEIASTQQALDDYRYALITEAVNGQFDVTRVSAGQMEESLVAVREGERPEVLAT
jgi:type I restriction enzyme, S subunit